MQRQIIEGKTATWKLTIGLEIHAQVSTNTKLFSRSSTNFGAAPNEQVSFVDAALPGTLPTLNHRAIEYAMKTGLAIGGTVSTITVFDRKNYFYADLPQGYQISQYLRPIIEGGKVILTNDEGKKKVVEIERIHLEQDAGKSMHDQSPTETFIDLNRSGIPLMEIVTKPDIVSSTEAGKFIEKLRLILRYLGTSDGDMEKGSLRCDANISVNKVEDEQLGTRVEIKNLNSIKYIIKAINYEAQRQVESIESGGTIVQETRLFDIESGITRPMRSKEDAQDYRYFPDPDLLPVSISAADINKIADTIPELPDAKKARYIESAQLSEYDAAVLTADKEVAEFFEEMIEHCDSKLAANWILGDLFAMLNKENISISQSKVTPELLSELILLITDKVISGKIAKDVFNIMFETGQTPSAIVEEKGLKQVSNEGEISKYVTLVIDQNQDKVQQYRAGKDKLFGYFVGQVMKLSKGKANPALVNEMLKKAL